MFPLKFRRVQRHQYLATIVSHPDIKSVRFEVYEGRNPGQWFALPIYQHPKTATVVIGPPGTLVRGGGQTPRFSSRTEAIAFAAYVFGMEEQKRKQAKEKKHGRKR